MEKPTTNKKPQLKTNPYWIVVPECMQTPHKHWFSGLRAEIELFFFVEFGDGTILLRRSSSASGLRKLMMIRGQDECRERLKIPCGKPAAHCKRATLENIYLPAKSRTTFLFSGISRVGDQTSIQSRICG